MFAGLMGKLIADSKPLAGKTLVSTHIDSWEVGSQNWTPQFREEFQRLRGYDPLPFLPVMTGRVVDSLEVSERFLWDLRQTVSDLLVENYAGHFRELAHRHGLAALDRGLRRRALRRHDLRRPGRRADGASSGRGDWHSAPPTVAPRWPRPPTSTASASSAPRRSPRPTREKWLGHPAIDQGPGRLGVLRGHQPLRLPPLRPAAVARLRSRACRWGRGACTTSGRRRGGSNRAAWHEYLARCQFLLQQGLFVADICYLQPEGSPQAFHAHRAGPLRQHARAARATTSTAARRRWCSRA